MALKATSPKRVKRPRKVIVTAGPTLEHIDPVRYISNKSTGLMGYSIAGECLKKGFSVCLISGPVSLEAPHGAQVVRVTTAHEMLRELTARSVSCDCVIMAAAVCDFRPAKIEKRKIKKKDELNIKFVKNKDIIGSLHNKKGFGKIAFALETDNSVREAETKLKNKGLDLIVLNTVGKGADPFGESVADYVLMAKNGEKRNFEKKNKKQIARIIVDEASKIMERRGNEK